ncbi:MAG: hypothetical protein ABSF95_05275 [Verrucomicrobiota bacterium]
MRPHGRENSDKYVYALSNNGFWDNGDNLILGCVAREKIRNLKSADWEYYAGGDGLESQNWIQDMNRAKLVLDSPCTVQKFIRPHDESQNAF